MFASASPKAPRVVDAPATDGVKDVVPVTLRINGKKPNLTLSPRTTLLDCLRETSTCRAPRRVATTVNAAPVRYM
jgi:hypothetical protein